MKKLIAMMMLAGVIGVSFTGCKSDTDKAKEAVEAYLYKNMKNPESLKILSCEIRLDTIPFYLSEEMFDMADKAREALNKFSHYNNMGYLFFDEKMEWAEKARTTQETLKTAYKIAQENDSIDVEYVAYVKSSRTNPMGGTVSSSSIIILDKNEPSKILGTYIVDSDFIQQFAALKMFCEDFDFKKNKFGKYITDDMPYFEQFIMNDAEWYAYTSHQTILLYQRENGIKNFLTDTRKNVGVDSDTPCTLIEIELLPFVAMALFILN